VEGFDAEAEGPFGALARDNARESLRVRIAWLERLEVRIREDGAGA
jgi:hypothetical protein